jgi:hypothetical protein
VAGAWGADQPASIPGNTLTGVSAVPAAVPPSNGVSTNKAVLSPLIGPPEYPGQKAVTLDLLPPSQDNLSPKPFVSLWLAEVVKLAHAGIEDSVMLTFIDSAGTFNLGSDQIVSLHEMGVSGRVIKAMLQHDTEIALGLRPVPSATPSIPPSLLPFAPGLLQDADARPQSPPSVGAPPIVLASSDSAMMPGGVDAEPSNPAGSTPAINGKPAITGAAVSPPTSVLPSYRIREPHAVTLTRPIIFVRSEPVPANAVLLERFP